MKKKEIKQFKSAVKLLRMRYEAAPKQLLVKNGLQKELYLIANYVSTQATEAILTYTEYHRNMRGEFEFVGRSELVPLRKEDYYFLLFLEQLTKKDYKDFSVFADYPTGNIPINQQKDIRK